MDSETSRCRMDVNYKMTGSFPAVWRVSARRATAFAVGVSHGCTADKRKPSIGLEDAGKTSATRISHTWMQPFGGTSMKFLLHYHIWAMPTQSFVFLLLVFDVGDDSSCIF